jgi:Xaa-Pro aminopeptidase
MNSKIKWLRNKLTGLNMQGMIVTNPVNIKYLTNIEFGKELLFTLFNTTAAIATCPAYTSPLASAYTTLASKFKSLEFTLVLVLVEELFIIPIAFNV